MKKELKIVYYDIKEINAAVYNPRSIEDGAREGLNASLEKYDLLAPLVLNVRQKKNVLASGHRRLEKLIADGFTKVPVVEVDLSEAEEKALNVTMNNPKITGYFNSDLEQVLRDIHAELGEDFLKGLNIEFNPQDDFNNSQYNIPILPPMEDREDAWESDISSIDKVKENLDGIPFKITITGKADDKDAVLFYLKEKLMEIAFEGVHIE